jgi:Tfp pilus assembly protein PilN
MRVLNLASRPVRNERLPGLVFTLAAGAMLLVTLQHATIVYRLLPGRSYALRTELAALRKESEALDTEKSQLARLTATPLQKTEWAAIKSLVDRRTFWWSKLFEVLEKTLPFEVKIVTVTPRIRDGRYSLDMSVRATTVDHGFEFVKALQRRDDFGDVSVIDVSKSLGASGTGSEADFRITMRYKVPTTESAAPAPKTAAKPAAAGAVAAAGAAVARPTAATPPAEGQTEGEVQPEAEADVEMPEAPSEGGPQ